MLHVLLEPRSNHQKLIERQRSVADGDELGGDVAAHEKLTALEDLETHAHEPNHRLLSSAKLIGEARTEAVFELYDLGAFPMLVKGGRHAIVGEVYEVDAEMLAALDRLEGHPRFYRRTRIALTDGTKVETYLLTPEQVAGRPIVASGNWRERRREKTA